MRGYWVTERARDGASIGEGSVSYVKEWTPRLHVY